MADISFKSYLITFLLTALFLICFYNFATGLRENYGQDSAIMDSDKIDLTTLETILNETEQEGGELTEMLSKDPSLLTFGSIIFKSMWTITKTMWSSTNAIFTLFLQSVLNIFGINPMVTGVITGIMIISIIFSIWRIFKTGQ